MPFIDSGNGPSHNVQNISSAGGKPFLSHNPKPKSLSLYMTKNSEIITDEELNLINQRCQAATPGPWQSFVENRDHTSGSSFIMTGVGLNRRADIELSGATAADQDFIANARQDIPKLLAEIARLKKS